jgi:hypothetical protein
LAPAREVGAYASFKKLAPEAVVKLNQEPILHKITSYNASVVKIYNAANSIARF